MRAAADGVCGAGRQARDVSSASNLCLTPTYGRPPCTMRNCPSLSVNVEDPKVNETRLAIERPRRGHTAPELAEAVRVSRATAYGMVARGEIRCVKVGRKIIIPDTGISRCLQRAS